MKGEKGVAGIAGPRVSFPLTHLYLFFWILQISIYYFFVFFLLFFIIDFSFILG